jgi:hypothetical protein
MDNLPTDYFFNRAQNLCEKIYESLPDGVHRHADGELYIHQTYCDPRNPNNKTFKRVEKL